MKLEVLRKKLIKDSLKVFGAVAACVALYVAVSTWSSSAVQGKNEVDGRSAQQQGEIASLRDKIENSGSSQKLYAELSEERQNENFTIHNEQVREVLQELVKRYRLGIKDKLEYSAEQEFRHPELTTMTTPMIVRQETKLNFSAISDIHAYGFIRALSRELPGVVRFTRLKFTRKAVLDKSVLDQLAQGQTVYTVEVEMAFDWFGFKEEEKADAEAAPAPEPGAAQ